ncbi:2',3'-cyclic-nucleotide 3'-phosphodiesterase [Fimicolochytrium jonesii]|uniref:2',3'-cyclic-nucleotide 3'-phosphodiesterase n=1 Tax=Fimicolochytrium jonesii TaxID=1396493 RepID=UPI0022FE99B5|nr:2',3'-cyclic-nucleotide 3'-phosphodiesterase [Fimicolochytrium jonesii]KAI8826049.1 2',3'-cyclic-nucleotide 3'-phosphodiesterase [Fimicolochytrium jonesii]
MADQPHSENEVLSLWAVPANPQHLADVIASLAEELGTSKFDPHITILGSIPVPKDEVLELTLKVAAEARRFNATLTEVTGHARFFECITATPSPTTELRTLRAAAEKIFEGHCQSVLPYRPHLSLLYGELDEPAKEAVIKRLKEQTGVGIGVLGEVIPIERLQIWTTGRSVEEWEMIGEALLDM